MNLLVAPGAARQLAQPLFAVDTLGCGTAHGGDAVLAGLVDQRFFIVYARQCRQPQLLVIALQGDVTQQTCLIEALDQCQAAVQADAWFTTHQQGDQAGRQFGRGGLVHHRQQGFRVADLRQGCLAYAGVLVLGQRF